jgi:hypothetical protein
MFTHHKHRFITLKDASFCFLQTESFVPSMSYQNNQLWMGDKAGKLNVMDTTDGLFDESLIKVRFRVSSCHSYNFLLSFKLYIIICLGYCL